MSSYEQSDLKPFKDICTQSMQASLCSQGIGPSTPPGKFVRGFRQAQVTMGPVEDIEEELRARRQYAKTSGAGEAYDSSDDEEGRGGQRVQCAQQ